MGATLKWNANLPEEQPEKCGNNLISGKTFLGFELVPQEMDEAPQTKPPHRFSVIKQVLDFIEPSVCFHFLPQQFLLVNGLKLTIPKPVFKGI